MFFLCFLCDFFWSCEVVEFVVVDIESVADFEIATSDKLSDSDNFNELSFSFRRGDVDDVIEVELWFFVPVVEVVLVKSDVSFVCVFDDCDVSPGSEIESV